MLSALKPASLIAKMTALSSTSSEITVRIFSGVVISTSQFSSPAISFRFGETLARHPAHLILVLMFSLRLIFVLMNFVELFF